jgi:acyl-homoserine lactone acylase PvdQ
MIGAIVVALLGVAAWIASLFNTVKKQQIEIQNLKSKDVKDEAKKIVDAKTPTELVDDFNKRYPSPSNGPSGEDDSNKPGGKGPF